jgi:hypothetical protein
MWLDRGVLLVQVLVSIACMLLVCLAVIWTLSRLYLRKLSLKWPSRDQEVHELFQEQMISCFPPRVQRYCTDEPREMPCKLQTYAACSEC